jgi:hypothetical protein
MKDRATKGRSNSNPRRGESVKTAKLNQDQVRHIRFLATQGITQTTIGQQFGITQSHVANIVNHRMWKHVP